MMAHFSEKILKTRQFRFSFICFLFLIILTLMIFFSPKDVFSLDVILAWDENTENDLAGYRIFCREEGQNYDYTVPAWEGTETTCTISGLNNNITYYFVARAFDNLNNESDNSNEVHYSPSDTINLPPSTPVINFPADGETNCELMPQIMTGSYSDPEVDPHGESRWQITNQDSVILLDVTSSEHLTELTVPHMILDPSTTYYTRVQFSDDNSAESGWSDFISFTTSSEVNDLNDNGIPDNKEVSDVTDLNQDEISDHLQPDDIKRIMLPNGSTMIGICKVSSNIIDIDSLDTIDPGLIPNSMDEYSDLTFGLFSYRLLLNEVGTTATIKIYFSEDISEATNYYKFDTVFGWQDCTQNVIFNEDGRSITITIVDGGLGDSDGVANGIIVDPGALVTYNIGALNSDNGAASAGGCFISTTGLFSNIHQWLLLPVFQRPWPQ